MNGSSHELHTHSGGATAAIMARGIKKSFGKQEALKGVDLEVPAGKVVALLGPNGAGKTTLVNILTTLSPSDEGVALVGGFDVAKQPEEVRRTMGLTGQFTAIDENLTGRENLVMVGELYHLGRRAAESRANELLQQFDLVEAADRVSRTYSGGMKRRIDLAASLVAKPKVLFLDEPTTGLDPKSRIDLWGIINDLVKEGTTILLTTQYLEEADHLADSIVVIDQGKIIARGTADELKRQVGGDVLEIQIEDSARITEAADALWGLGTAVPHKEPEIGKVTLPVTGGASVLVEAVRRYDLAGIVIRDLVLRRPSLDDVFLALTGRTSEEESRSAAVVQK